MDVEQCKAAVQLNPYLQDRCRLYFVSLGGDASACATIRAYTKLVPMCQELSRL
jgi:hypothetical protein